MPSNNPPTNTVNLPTGNLLAGLQQTLISKGLTTFKGWWARKSIGWSATIGGIITAYMVGGRDKLEQVASLHGASAETLTNLHAQTSSLITVAVGLVATIIAFIGDLILSRIAAKYPEAAQPAPVAIPTDQQQ